jgi:hypothetical protein
MTLVEIRIRDIEGEIIREIETFLPFFALPPSLPSSLPPSLPIPQRLSGQVGLLATNRTREEVLTYFENFKVHPSLPQVQDFAKPGVIADADVTLEPSKDPLHFFPTSMFQLFRKCVLSLPPSLPPSVPPSLPPSLLPAAIS